MALVKATLKSGIQALLADMRTKEENADEHFADQLAKLIDTYIKSATVATTVTGVCATPAGAGTITGSGTGTLS
jgi:hypothetical protein